MNNPWSLSPEYHSLCFLLFSLFAESWVHFIIVLFKGCLLVQKDSRWMFVYLCICTFVTPFCIAEILGVSCIIITGNRTVFFCLASDRANWQNFSLFSICIILLFQRTEWFVYMVVFLGYLGAGGGRWVSYPFWYMLWGIFLQSLEFSQSEWHIDRVTWIIMCLKRLLNLWSIPVYPSLAFVISVSTHRALGSFYCSPAPALRWRNLLIWSDSAWTSASTSRWEMTENFEDVYMWVVHPSHKSCACGALLWPTAHLRIFQMH